MITEVAALKMTVGTLASVTSSATARAFGDQGKPATNCTFSRRISSSGELTRLGGVRPAVVAVDDFDLVAVDGLAVLGFW